MVQHLINPTVSPSIQGASLPNAARRQGIGPWRGGNLRWGNHDFSWSPYPELGLKEAVIQHVPRAIAIKKLLSGSYKYSVPINEDSDSSIISIIFIIMSSTMSKGVSPLCLLP